MVVAMVWNPFAGLFGRNKAAEALSPDENDRLLDLRGKQEAKIELTDEEAQELRGLEARAKANKKPTSGKGVRRPITEPLNLEERARRRMARLATSSGTASEEDPPAAAKTPIKRPKRVIRPPRLRELRSKKDDK